VLLLIKKELIKVPNAHWKETAWHQRYAQNSLKILMHWKPEFKLSAIMFHVCSVSERIQHMIMNILPRC
jgi:hypothetical protein